MGHSLFDTIGILIISLLVLITTKLSIFLYLVRQHKPSYGMFLSSIFGVFVLGLVVHSHLKRWSL